MDSAHDQPDETRPTDQPRNPGRRWFLGAAGAAGVGAAAAASAPSVAGALGRGRRGRNGNRGRGGQPGGRNGGAAAGADGPDRFGRIFDRKIVMEERCGSRSRSAGARPWASPSAPDPLSVRSPLRTTGST